MIILPPIQSEMPLSFSGAICFPGRANGLNPTTSRSRICVVATAIPQLFFGLNSNAFAEMEIFFMCRYWPHQGLSYSFSSLGRALPWIETPPPVGGWRGSSPAASREPASSPFFQPRKNISCPHVGSGKICKNEGREAPHKMNFVISRVSF